MSDTATTAESGPLSIDQAVELLNPPEVVEEAAPVEAVEEPQSEAEPTAEEAIDPEETPAIEGEEEAELESDPEEAPPVIAAPKSWDAEERALFATLPPKAQATILARETERDKAVSQAQREASEARQRVETEVAGVGVYKAKLDTLLTQAQTTFADKWSNIDWAAWASEDPQAAFVAKFQFDEEKSQLKAVEDARTQAADLEFQSYLKAEAAKLPTVAPELVDPKEGPARQKALGQYLLDGGYTPQQIREASASDLATAYKAMRWDQAQAKPAASKTPAQTPAAAARQPIRATAPPPQQSPQQRTANTAKNRFAQTNSVDDAVAVLLAKGT